MASNSASRSRERAGWSVGLVALALSGLSGCDVADSTLGQARTALSQASALLGLSPSPGPSAKPGVVPASPEPTAPTEDPREKAHADLELLSEMFRVIFLHDPTSPSSRAMLLGLASTRNQGASLDGLYNGLTHSADYRQLEIERRGALPQTLSLFAIGLARLEADLPVPAHFDASAAQPLAAPVEPAYRNVGADRPDMASPSPVAVDIDHLAAEYATTFSQASFYTLKRIAGDEALKVVAAHSVTPERRALWYSKWAVQMAALGIDFGLPLRNSTDENFHYKWALSVPDDRVMWEVLNRVHRVLNKGVSVVPPSGGEKQ